MKDVLARVGVFALALGPFVGAACTEPKAPVAAPVAIGPAPSASLVASVSPVVSASASASAIASAAPRAIVAPAACVGDKLDYAAVRGPCACEIPFRATDKPAHLCDDVEGDEPAVKAGLVATATLEPAEVKSGGAAVLVVRYVNTSAEPLHVRIDVDPHDDPPPLFDAKHARVPVETDASCHEMGALGMASFGLVVLAPGGVLESRRPWRATHERRKKAAEFGCESAVGTPLRAGAYTLEWTTYQVWNLRDKPLKATVTVR